MAKPTAIDDTGWITPGKVAWDWYNANNIFGVDFTSGLNTATYKYYIDFAASNNIEYVILDEGWTKSTTEILDFNPDIDVPGIDPVRQGKRGGINPLGAVGSPLIPTSPKSLKPIKVGV